MRAVCAIALALGVAGCTVSSGERAQGFADQRLAAAYLPLSATAFLVSKDRGAGVIVARNVAVTNAHNANLLDPKSIIGKSRGYDLLFFHTDRPAAPPTAGEPRMGEHVLAYGEGTGGDLRVAHGVVTRLDAPVQPVCSSCGPQSAFTFAGDAGEGFSGGPVVDADDGRLVGIVFGYVDGQPRQIYAYGMRRVSTELGAVEGRLPADPD